MAKVRQKYRYVYVLQQMFNHVWHDIAVRDKNPYERQRLLEKKSRMPGISRLITRRLRREP